MMAGLAAESEWVELFVPGRLCVIGEHSDWAGGFRRLNPVSLPKGILEVFSMATQQMLLLT